MEEHELREKIQRLISRNKTEEVFELLSSIQFSKADKQLIILNSQYNKVKEELRLNLISREEGERKVNQINMALLELSHKIKPGADQAGMGGDGGKGLFNQKLWWLLLIPLALIIYFVVDAQQPPAGSSEGSVDMDSLIRADSIRIADSIRTARDKRLKDILADSSLVAHFPMDGNYLEEKSKLTDFIFNVKGCANRHQEKNKARMFNGINSRIELDTTFLPATVDSFSIALWIWVDEQENTSAQAIIGQFTDSDLYGHYVGYNHLISLNTGKNYIGMDQYPPGGYEKSTADGIRSLESYNRITINEWIHVVIVRTPTGEKIYINGEPETSSRDNEEFENRWGDPVRTIIGSRPRVKKWSPRTERWSVHFKGKLDDILFFDTALDPETIKFLSTM